MNEQRNIPTRFPKVLSPYTRAESDTDSYIIEASERPYVQTDFEWVFNRADEVAAVEKLDGTNMAVYVEDGDVVGGATRYSDRSMGQLDPFGPTTHHFLTQAVQNSIRRGYIDFVSDSYGDGWFFGEAVGPKIQGNPHELDERLFIPFDWLRDKCEYESYGQYETDFASIKQWFAGKENGLFSLFASRMHGQDLRSSRPDNGTFVEGIIFVHPDQTGPIRPGTLTQIENRERGVRELAKLRRDMFRPYAQDEWPLTMWGHN
jgi:hypothetical protein